MSLGIQGLGALFITRSWCITVKAAALKGSKRVYSGTILSDHGLTWPRLLQIPCFDEEDSS